MINPQTKSHLYRFDGNNTHSPGMVSLLAHADPYNVIMEFDVVDVECPHNMILGRLWLYMMKVVQSTYHQLVRYPTPTDTTDIRGNQAISRTISVIARKKSSWRPKDCKGNLQRRFSHGQEAEADCYTIQSQSGRSQDSDSSSESKASDSKSKEEAELFHANPHHPEQVLRIGTKLCTNEKT